MIDLDPQGASTRSLGLEVGTVEPDLWLSALSGSSSLNKLIRPSSEKVDVVIATEGLFQADLFLAPRVGRELALKRAMGSLGAHYDIAIIDTPPYLGILTLNALCAANWVLVPISCEFLPIYGLKYLLDVVETVRATINPSLKVLGYVLNIYDRREKMSSEVESAIRKNLGAEVFNTVIRTSTKIKRAPSAGVSIFSFDPKGRGAADFSALTKEVISRIFSKE